MDQYTGFTNPTIQPEEKYGWRGANQSMQGGIANIADYLRQRQQQENILNLVTMKANAEEQAKLRTQQQDPMYQMRMNAIKNMQSNPQFAGMMGGGDQSGFQAAGQFNPVAGAQPQGQGQSQSAEPSQYSMNPNFMFGGNEPFVANPAYKLYQDEQKERQKPESSDATQAITYRNLFKDELGKIKGIVGKDDFDWGFAGAARAATMNPSIVSFGQNFDKKTGKFSDPKAQDLSDIANSLNFIKRSVFGEAGKALTEGEKQVIFSTLDPTGQTKQNWMKNLDVALNILDQRAKMMAKNPANLEGAINAPQTNTKVPKSRPAGATHYSPSTNKFYDAQGNEIDAST